MIEIKQSKFFMLLGVMWLGGLLIGVGQSENIKRFVESLIAS